jgi:hypothetical protein
MKRTIAMGILLLVAGVAVGQSKIEVTREEHARRLEKIKRIAAESQGKIEVTIITESAPVKTKWVQIATESESDRRFRRIQRIAAESEGKIEVARITEGGLTDKGKADFAPESEAARRLRKIQQIAAESDGKIEISILPAADSTVRSTDEQTEIVASADQVNRSTELLREARAESKTLAEP